MKLIPLSKGLFAQVDDEDYDKVNKFKWQAYTAKRTYYVMRQDWNKGNPRNIRLHRYIMDVTDSKILIDHKDHNGLNCQKNNLRKCTASQNSANQRSHKDSSSKYVGVYFRRDINKWVAQIALNKKVKNLGHFTNEGNAALAYNEAAKIIHGEFANLNVII